MNIRKTFIKEEVQKNIDFIEKEYLDENGEHNHILKNSPELVSLKSCEDSLNIYYMQLEIAKLREELDLLKKRK